MPKTIKYVKAMMEKLESQNSKMIREKGEDYSFITEVKRNDVHVKLQRSVDSDVEYLTVKRFGTTVLVILRKLSKEDRTGANLSVTLHPGAYSGSDRDCISTVLDALFVYQIDNVTARGGNIQLHYTARDEQGTQLLALQCTDGGEATLML